MLNCPNRNCLLTAMPVLRWREGHNGVLHLGAYCPGCGSWERWVPQNAEWLERAPARPNHTVSEPTKPHQAVQQTLF